MKKALVFLLVCAGYAMPQTVRDVYVRGPYFDVIRNEPWAISHWFVFKSYTPTDKICLSVYSHNPITSHAISGNAAGTGDPAQGSPIALGLVWKNVQLNGSAGLSPFAGIFFDGSAAAGSRMTGTILPLGTEQIEIDMRGSAQVLFSWATDGVGAGTPDVYSITGVVGSCGFREGGHIASLFSANPAANTEIAVTVPPYVVWRVMGATATLVTGVAVPNRLVTLIVDDGANELFRVNAAVTQAASLTYSYSFASAVSDTVVPGNVVKLPQLLVKSGWRIRTFTTNLAAADDWSAMRLLVEEWAQ
jgi:hypothetical protein